jgi:hypothetical protein
MIMANPYMGVFSNIYFAVFYLAVPYILMAGIDYRARKIRVSQSMNQKQVTDEYFGIEQPPKAPLRRS